MPTILGVNKFIGSSDITNGSVLPEDLSPLVGLLPVATVLPTAAAAAPTGFLLCNGSAQSRTTYADLFAAIGTTYGAGDGSTTFNLPNLIGRTVIGAGNYTDPVTGSTTRTLATALGAAAHQLSIAEMPNHSHTVFGSSGWANANTHGVNRADGGPENATTSAQGGSGQHNNMQPSLVLNWIIKV